MIKILAEEFFFKEKDQNGLAGALSSSIFFGFGLMFIITIYQHIW